MPIRIDHDRKTAVRETDHGPLAMAYDKALEALRLGLAYEAGAEE